MSGTTVPGALAPALAREIAQVEGAVAAARRALAENKPVDLTPLHGMVKTLREAVAAGPVGDVEVARQRLAALITALDELARELAERHNALLAADAARGKTP
jgi:hypothetical protein